MDDEKATKLLHRALHTVVDSYYATRSSHHFDDAYHLIERLATSHPRIFSQKYILDHHHLQEEELPIRTLALRESRCRGDYRSYYVALAQRPVPIGVIEATLDAYPEAIRIRDQKTGNLLIHDVCRWVYRNDVIQLLLQTYPESALQQGEDLRTPLHFACDLRINNPWLPLSGGPDVIPFLLDACPQAALFMDKFDCSPLSTLLILYGISRSSIREAVVGMVRYNPSFAASSLDDQNDGGTPLRYALRRPTVRDGAQWREPIKALVEAHPNAVLNPQLLKTVWTVDHSWELRLYVFGHYHARKQAGAMPLSYHERYPLHAILHVLRDQGHIMTKGTLSTTIACFEAFKDQVCHLDDMGQLPLHVALLPGRGDSRTIPIKALKYLVDLEPRTMLVRDPTSGLYPFLAIASSNASVFRYVVADMTKHVDLIYRAFRVDSQRFLLGTILQRPQACLRNKSE